MQLHFQGLTPGSFINVLAQMMLTIFLATAVFKAILLTHRLGGGGLARGAPVEAPAGMGHCVIEYEHGTCSADNRRAQACQERNLHLLQYLKNAVAQQLGYAVLFAGQEHNTPAAQSPLLWAANSKPFSWKRAHGMSMSKHTFACRSLLPCPLRKRSSAGAFVCNLAGCSPPQTDSDSHRSLEGSRAASGQPGIVFGGDPGGGSA